MTAFLDALNRHQVLLMDGAMGTQLLHLGLPLPTPLANLTAPSQVHRIHEAYAAAGARVHLTNTFQANARLFTDASQLQTICRQAVTIARGAIGHGLLLGSLGPAEPEPSRQPLDCSAYRDAVNSLVEAGVDGLLLETFSTRQSLNWVHWLRRYSLTRSMPIALSLTFRHGPDGQPVGVDGTTPEYFGRVASDAGVDALGVNCGLDFDGLDCADVIIRYRSQTRLPVFARPNAGADSTPALLPLEIAKQWSQLLTAGVAMIGGCCGTTPAHIAALARLLQAN